MVQAELKDVMSLVLVNQQDLYPIAMGKELLHIVEAHMVIHVIVQAHKLFNMKKVEFMKLNLQQENILSKEERKEVLGGSGSNTCYVQCNGYSYSFPIPSCDSIAIGNACDHGAVKCSC